MSFTIVIPAYNEFEELQKNIPPLSKYFPEAEIIIVENGSNIAPSFEYLPNVREILSFNRGLGVALKAGIAYAHNNTVIFLPADMSYDVSFVKKARELIENGYDLVIGSKALKESEVHRPRFRLAISKLYNLWYNFGLNLKVKDITGVKAYNRCRIFHLLFQCPSDGIRFEVELIQQLRKTKMKIIEIPVRVYDKRISRYSTI